MSTTFNELLDAGICTGGCLLAPPRTTCDCRCRGYFHGVLVDYLNRRSQVAEWEFPGYGDIDIIRRGRRLRMIDHSEPGLVLWGRSA